MCTLCLLYHIVVTTPGVHATLVNNSHIGSVIPPLLRAVAETGKGHRLDRRTPLRLLGRVCICERQCCFTFLQDEAVGGGCLYILLMLYFRLKKQNVQSTRSVA